jgi:hypothetical protein
VLVTGIAGLRFEISNMKFDIARPRPRLHHLIFANFLPPETRPASPRIDMPLMRVNGQNKFQIRIDVLPVCESYQRSA